MTDRWSRRLLNQSGLFSSSVPRPLPGISPPQDRAPQSDRHSGASDHRLINNRSVSNLSGEGFGEQPLYVFVSLSAVLTRPRHGEESHPSLPISHVVHRRRFSPVIQLWFHDFSNSTLRTQLCFKSFVFTYWPKSCFETHLQEQNSRKWAGFILLKRWMENKQTNGDICIK